ncbi:probable E3 ubiquitin-protein ligase RHY1A isoform X2 [Punica granatum]|uniref:RING-type domain-containing protein n=2 Tax=Punica granatum TaxID=22663 RepID=A0A218X2L7_PUNGR|nr:probable E3 ubiquitin-protein ligase RHY1A isoform X2 [Punica granatum]OWM79174.1 hypothetical protein CDL15_Pgr003345 [Punica granatum]PKI71366.1 hypothetical protein CRG98_008225 [Punica granatum]
MTSASELFYNRRSRLSRTAASASSIGDPELGFEYSSDRSLRFSHQNRRQSLSHGHHSHSHDLDGCDPLRRSPLPRHHRFSHSERPSLVLDQTNQQSGTNNSRNAESQRNVRRPGISTSDRLPGSVLLARERLLERLRGVSLSGSRRSSRDPSSTNRIEHAYAEHWRLADAFDWGAEASIQFPSGGSDLNDSTLLSERTISTSTEKPPGLSQEALDQLHVEIFSYYMKEKEGMMERKSQDCSICLENFMEGDKLICLPCEHWFHSTCLDPWVRTCGDCPYCRKGIIAVPTERN